MSKRVIILFELPMMHLKPISQMMKSRMKRTTGQHSTKQHTLEQKLQLPQHDEWSSG